MSNVKKKFYKRWWFWLIVIVLVGGAIASGSESDAKKVDDNKPKAEASKDESKETENKVQKFKVGDTVEIKDYKVRVNKVTTSKGGEIIQPKKGNEFLKVDVTVENISKETQNVSSVLMFKVVDKDGRSYDQAITENQNGQLDGEVGPGRKITGEYVVEVPKGSKGLELEFDSSLISSGQVIVDLN